MQNNDIRTSYQCDLHVISPIHVGTGEKSFADLDYIHSNNELHFIDMSKMFSVIKKMGHSAINEFTEAIEKKTIKEWLDQQRINPVDISKTSYPSFDQKQPWQIQTNIRDGFGRPFLPGSSLKGAFRTAIIRRLAKADKTLLSKLALSVNRNIETKHHQEQQQIKLDTLLANLLGDDPKNDLMRTLSIGDFSFNVDDTGLQNVRVYRMENPTGPVMNRKRTRSGNIMGPITVEKLCENSCGKGMFSFDDFLLYKDVEESCFNFKKSINLPWLIESCRSLTEHTIKTELSFFKDKSGEFIQDFCSFYTDLEKMVKKLQKNETIIQLGWGSGWRGITGQLLEADELSIHFRKNYLKQAKRYHDFPFPKSRRAAEINNKFVPMGWARLSFTALDKIRKNELETRRQRMLIEIQHKQVQVEAKALQTQWEHMSEEDRDVAAIAQNTLALNNEPNIDPLRDIWPKVDSVSLQHRKKIALAFMEKWQSVPEMWHKNKCSKKQWKKVLRVKKILEEE